MRMAMISITIARTAMPKQVPIKGTVAMRTVPYQHTKTSRNTNNERLRAICYRGMNNDNGTAAGKGMGLVGIIGEATPYRILQVHLYVVRSDCLVLSPFTSSAVSL